MSNYDSWKLASPPGYDAPDCCPSCGEQDGFAGDCCEACGWNADDDDAAYGRHIDMQIDAARGK